MGFLITVAAVVVGLIIFVALFGGGINFGGGL